ncbi:hypothetical protein B0H16DRAFT_1305548 [Mycena metata]|uniref:Uncharacterized protein n=1 Tax=Mycena metata TaxID=1033252 RepID=A0AAD7NRM7_9AGAR|nr:hypothetical protein B0H16DRAFT_1305548 [Mycena metata]
MRETHPFVHPTPASTDEDEAPPTFLFPVEAGTGQKPGETMARFFARRQQSNQERQLTENDDLRHRRIQRELNAAKGTAPGKKGALVFVWELRGENYIRVPGGRDNYEALWDEYPLAQRRYDSFRNEWDLCEEFEQVEAETDRRPIKMIEEDDEDDDDDPTSVADLTRMYPASLPSINPQSPPVIASSDKVEEAVYRRFGCDLGLQQDKIQSPHTLPKDAVLAKTLGDRDTPRLPDDKWHNLGVFLADCKALVNDLPSIHLLDFNYPTSRINSAWKMDVKRFEVAADVHYLVQEVDDPGPLFIIVKSATTVLEIVRQNWGPSVGAVAEHMLARGMPFHLCSKNSHCLFAPPAPVIDPWPIHSGLGYRGAEYKPTDGDYAYYEAARTHLLLTERGQVALRSGGLIARIASDVVSLDRALLGPSDRVVEQGVCFRPRHAAVAFWDDKLTEDEENLICGVYYVATGTLALTSHKFYL